MRSSATNSSERTLRALFLLAAAPAVLGSVALMRSVGVGSAVPTLQAGAFVLGGLLVMLWPTRSRPPGSGKSWPMFGLALLLFLPLVLGPGDGPQRWLQLGAFRLYLASLVLPALLVLGGARIRPSSSAAWLLTMAALAMQPDRAQALAFVPPACLLLWRAAGAPAYRWLIALALAIGAAIAWLRPDPLLSVPHVEGVFRLAAQHGVWALAAALGSALLPTTVFAGLAWRKGSLAVFALSLQAFGLIALAPLEITPIPLLGFGLGPLLGHLWISAWAARALANAPEVRT